MVKKFRISTTISSKHYEIFKKHSAKYDSQQSLLEHALESLENNTKPDFPLSVENETWMRIGKDLKTSVIILPINIVKMLIETSDIERFREYYARNKVYEFFTEYFYQKPLKDCTLPELMDIIVLILKFENYYKTINYTDEGDFYILKMIHNGGLKNSTFQLIPMKCLFESYGVKIESHITENSVFIRVYKNR